MHVCLDGMDCTGKTTLANRLCEELVTNGFNAKIKAFPERSPVVQAYLDGDTSISPARFQTACLIQKYRFQVQKEFNLNVWITDRWGPSGTVYGYLDKEHPKKLFKDYEDANLSVLRKPDIGFILVAEPSVVLERLNMRGNAPELYETEDKLFKLYEYFTEYCNKDLVYTLIDTSHLSLNKVYTMIKTKVLAKLRGAVYAKTKTDKVSCNSDSTDKDHEGSQSSEV